MSKIDGGHIHTALVVVPNVTCDGTQRCSQAVLIYYESVLVIVRWVFLHPVCFEYQSSTLNWYFVPEQPDISIISH